MKSVISSSLSVATAHSDLDKKTVVHQPPKANHQCGCAQLPAMTWHSGECITDAVALSATERQNEQAILPAMPALKDFECHASTSTFCLKQDRSTTGKEPSLLILDAARLEAGHDARALMSSAVLLGYDIASRSVEIRNETGYILLVLPFSEAVKRVG
ncbi:DUF6894 family protein [Rhizobium leguminosarum]|uniref:DUF6894 family protein n=1 Tax=Rhizobium leguminosarum TaxID=384 RepID=UPI001FEDC933|nr:hypothetical protein [Rhizobium leguminosarum]